MTCIYHYTSLPAFISIIKNKQLKLTRLDKFVEFYEPKGFFPDNLAREHEFRLRVQNLYVLSWMKDGEESIGLWKLFSNINTGIRIGIDIEKFLSKSNNVESIIKPISLQLHGDNFKQKETITNLKMYEIYGCIDCKSEINKVLYYDVLKPTDMTYEEYIRRKSKLPFISSNPLAYNNEVRFVAEIRIKNSPKDKREMRLYKDQLFLDNQIEFVTASLPSCFFNEIEIIVSPNFSETDLIMLNALLTRYGLREANRSKITSIYNSYKKSYEYTKILSHRWEL